MINAENAVNFLEDNYKIYNKNIVQPYPLFFLKIMNILMFSVLQNLIINDYNNLPATSLKSQKYPLYILFNNKAIFDKQKEQTPYSVLFILCMSLTYINEL